MKRQEELVQAARKEYPEWEEAQCHYIDGAHYADSRPRWVSVKDELPPTSDKDDESDDYLIVDSDGDMNVGYYNKMDKLWFSIDCYILDVTHWMPLPKPPIVEVRTIYDVIADESYAIATEDEEGGEE